MGLYATKSLLFTNRSLAHVYVKLDGLGLFIDAPYVAAPLHGLDAPPHG